MARKCSVCKHESKEAIDRALIGGEPLSAISALFRVSEDSLYRHRANHLSKALVSAAESKEASAADELLSQVQDLHSRALAILVRAERNKQDKVALQAIKETRGILELLAKLMGELRNQQTFNITLCPEWINLRTVIVNALDPYPEARIALVERLVQAERRGVTQ